MSAKAYRIPPLLRANVQLYGMTKHRDLFTPRQLVGLTTFSDLVSMARERARRDAVAAGLADDGLPLAECGAGAAAYADAVATYLSMFISRMADLNNALCQWRSDPAKQHVGHLFARQAIAMVWDFAEANPLGPSAGGWDKTFLFVPKFLDAVGDLGAPGNAIQRDAMTSISYVSRLLVSTDPPYYDNVPYADLSDFFYVWLRRSLGPVYPDLFSTLLTPKGPELVADPFRHGGRDNAHRFFERGLGAAFTRTCEAQDSRYPLTVYYAFKQSETEEDENAGRGSNGAANVMAVASTGWETMLEGLLEVGFSITGTWPMHSELGNRMRSLGSNALASSIVLVCRPRSESAPSTTRREFIAALRRELPDALKKLQHGNVAPVDLAQASIGPGMAIFSRYGGVLEANGSPMPVRVALQIINQELDAYLTAQEGEMDPDTRFCVDWFRQYGMRTGKFGDADVLARAKNTSVEGLKHAGMLYAEGGEVRLRARTELDPEREPRASHKVMDWECTQHLILALNADGEAGAARLVRSVGAEKAQIARDLSYRLYAICERKGWADEALAYNALVASWPAIQQKAAGPDDEQQERLI